MSEYSPEGVVLRPTGVNVYEFAVDGVAHQITDVFIESGCLRFELDGEHYEYAIYSEPGAVWLGAKDSITCLREVDQGAVGEPARGEGQLVSQMPGRVLQLLVDPGRQVEAGTPLVILEAMKMEHQVLAPGPGTVLGFPVEPGQRIMPGALLVDFRPSDAAV